MSECTSLVKIDRERLLRAYNNYEVKYKQALDAEKIAVEKYKDTIEFSWWDKLWGTHNLTSSALLVTRCQHSWDDPLEELSKKGLINREQYTLLKEYGSKWRDEVKTIIDSNQTEILLGTGALQWVVNWGDEE